MHVRQLVTILGICLSHVQAHAIPSAFDPSDSIKPIVRLVTTPHEVLQTSVPQLKETQKVALQESPSLYTHQLTEGLIETFGSLLYMNDNPTHDFTALIAGSLNGYYRTIRQELPEGVRQSRLQTYQDSLYSRLHDLAKELGPEEWQKHAEAAQRNLENGLIQFALASERMHVAPAGDKSIMEEIGKVANKIKEDRRHQTLLAKVAEWNAHIKTHLPYNADLKEMNYLTKEEVESALKKTNHPGLEPALSVNYFTPMKSANQKISPAATHPTGAGPAQLPPSPPRVAAAA